MPVKLYFLKSVLYSQFPVHHEKGKKHFYGSRRQFSAPRDDSLNIPALPEEAKPS